MDEDSDSTNWVIVEETDCVDDLLALKPPVSAATDSDQESDGSISIISNHSADSYSEEEHEQPPILKEVEKIIPPLITIDSDSEASGTEEENHVQVPEIESSNNSEDAHVEDVSEAPTQDSTISHEENDSDVSSTSESSSIKNAHVEDFSETPTQDSKTSHEANDGDVSSISESSSTKNWAYMDEKSKVELESSEKLFYLDCSQEPVLEISPNETEVDSFDTESTPSTNECQKIAKRQEISVSTVSNKEPSRDGTLNRIGIGLLISVMVLFGSHLIQQYSECQNDTVQSPSESFLEGLADNEKARAVIDFCMDRQKSKGEYSERAVEKCVIKRLRKKNKEEAMKKTEIYLQMKEHILTLREKELAEKERDILRKWRKRSFSGENTEPSKHKSNYNNEKRQTSMSDLKSSKGFDKKQWKKSGYKEKKWHNSEEYDSENEKKDETKNCFNKKYSWNVEEGKEISDYKHKNQPIINTNKKKFKMYDKHKEEKKKVKKLNNIKPNLKYFKGDRNEDPNEEWYIKYNPIKNTIELINITTLPEQDSVLIKNGNKTINGQWYFSLYGSRANIRNKEKAADWYFKRGYFRENKRDKAKWYFNYMSARDNARYFY